MTSLKNIKMDENRTFGIEIETLIPNPDNLSWGRLQDKVAATISSFGVTCNAEYYNHDTASYWKVVEDVSIDNTGFLNHLGFEVVSPALSGITGLRQIEKVCKALDHLNAQINVSCGLHVHHDARDYRLNNWKTLLKTYVKYEETIDSLLPRSRRGDSNRFCKSLKKGTVKSTCAVIDSKSTLSDIMHIWSHEDGWGDVVPDRYIKLNLSAYLRHGTVEFRQHGGTVEFEKIMNWVLFTQGLVTRGMTAKVVKLKVPSKNDWIKSVMYQAGFMNKSTHKFYIERQRVLAA